MTFSFPIPFTPVLAAAQSNAALWTFLVYTVFVFVIAGFSNQLMKKKSFLSEYFLGSRSLGVWAFALTFAATSSSGGSFTGFPAKIYSHGWVLALWIGSYMVVPICAMGLMGKRLNHIARISGAITIPDIVRDRFRSPLIGLLAVLLIVFFMAFNLVAQFKAGSFILMTLLDGVSVYQSVAHTLGNVTDTIPYLVGIEHEYLLCLLTFGIAVIVYTTYGGFHAVVWTDVMQGVIMVIGVLIMLPLALSQVGGLENATRKMAEMTPPHFGKATLTRTENIGKEEYVSSGTWLLAESLLEHDGVQEKTTHLFRVTKPVTFEKQQTEIENVDILEITTPGEIESIVEKEKLSLQSQKTLLSKIETKNFAFPANNAEPGTYVTGPGPSPDAHDGFLPLSLAISFFFMWAISGAGQPATMVRLMAFNSTRTLRRSIFTVALYYSAIYFPLVIIFCCARVLMPGMDAEPDKIMPEMAILLTDNIGMGWLAGLLVAAPFAAVMSTVDSFLLLISSAVVRDIYQRNINPETKEKTIKMLSYLCTLVVGIAAMLGAVNPPQFLQDIIVYTGSGLAACFLAPFICSLYWPRVNVQGAMGSMLCGFSAHLSMYFTGIFTNGSFFKPYRLLDFDPILVGLVASFSGAILITLITPPPPKDLVRKYFYKPVSKS